MTYATPAPPGFNVPAFQEQIPWCRVLTTAHPPNLAVQWKTVCGTLDIQEIQASDVEDVIQGRTKMITDLQSAQYVPTTRTIHRARGRRSVTRVHPTLCRIWGPTRLTTACLPQDTSLMVRGVSFHIHMEHTRIVAGRPHVISVAGKGRLSFTPQHWHRPRTSRVCHVHRTRSCSGH